MIDKNDEKVAVGIARVCNLLPTFYIVTAYSFIQTSFGIKFSQKSQLLLTKNCVRKNKGVIYYSLPTS